MCSTVETALAIVSESDDSTEIKTMMLPCSVCGCYSCTCPAGGQTMMYQACWMHTGHDYPTDFVICAPLSSSGSAADYEDSLPGNLVGERRNDDVKDDDPEAEPEPEEVQQQVASTKSDTTPTLLAQCGWQHYTAWGWLRPLVNEPSAMDLAVYNWLTVLFRRECPEAVLWPWKRGDNEWWIRIDVCPATILLADLPFHVHGGYVSSNTKIETLPQLSNFCPPPNYTQVLRGIHAGTHSL